MDKIKLLLCAGTNYSATSPLFYTLCQDNRYCHPGHRKEWHYLHIMQSNGEEEYKKFHGTPNDEIIGKPPNLLKDSKWVKDKWTKEEEDYYFSRPLTIEKYVSYYKKHWENIKCDYQSVCDFSNNNAALTSDFMLGVKNELIKHFDVKVIMIFRDPIRRLYSFSRNNETFQKRLEGPLDDSIREYKGWKYSYYDEIYHNYRMVWGDSVYYIIMEEFWENPKGLSEFLDFPITKVHENVYWPERGSNAPKHDYLRDQWSDEEDISQESIDLAKKRMDSIYQDFNDTFGYIPDSWHSL